MLLSVAFWEAVISGQKRTGLGHLRWATGQDTSGSGVILWTVSRGQGQTLVLLPFNLPLGGDFDGGNTGGTFSCAASHAAETLSTAVRCRPLLASWRASPAHSAWGGWWRW